MGVFTAARTPEGVDDLAGNVWEWTRTDRNGGAEREDFACDPAADRLYRKYLEATEEGEKHRLAESIKTLWDEPDRQLPWLRGGSWYRNRANARCTCRDYSGGGPMGRSNSVGFRCVREGVG